VKNFGRAIQVARVNDSQKCPDCSNIHKSN